jgi:hypothetical protein
MKNELVDGRKNQLPEPQILIGAISNIAKEERPIAALGNLATYMAAGRSQMIQVLNTVFMYRTGTKDVKHYAECYVFNLDTPENLYDNTFRFLSLIQKRGIKICSITTRDENFLRTMVRLIPKLDKLGTQAAVGESKKTKYPMYLTHVKFGNTLLGSKNESKSKKRNPRRR